MVDGCVEGRRGREGELRVGLETSAGEDVGFDPGGGGEWVVEDEDMAEDGVGGAVGCTVG